MCVDNSKSFYRLFSKKITNISEIEQIHLYLPRFSRQNDQLNPVGSINANNNVTNNEIGSQPSQSKPCLTSKPVHHPTSIQSTVMCENSQSSVEEIISIDDGAIGAVSDQNSTYATIPFSKKAIHQRDADENLFLRFLELDPDPDEVTATIPPIVDPKSTPDQRRKSTYRPISGRTPFTITKKLIRTNDSGYGFSIVWTHPPRIEKVEPGLSADRVGLLPGDFVIFVDKHNVVTMPEIDILNLIRSQGSVLMLEIFRRSANRASNGISKSRVSSLTISNTQPTEPPTPKQMATTTMLEPRPSTACSNVSFSMETSKRRLNLPQVTFSKEVSFVFGWLPYIFIEFKATNDAIVKILKFSDIISGNPIFDLNLTLAV